MEFILRYKWARLAYLTTILILINVTTIYFFDIQVSRIIRVSSTVVFLLFFIHQRGFQDKLIFTILLLFFLKDIFIVDYEISLNKTFAFLVCNVTYLLLGYINFKKVKLMTKNPMLMVFAFAMIALNAFNLYYLSDVILMGLNNSIQFALFFTQGVLLITLGLIAFAYNDRYDGNTPLLFLYFSFCLILCDLSGLASYFFEWEVAYFPERIFYLLSIALLINFSFNRSFESRESLLFLEQQIAS